MYEIQKLSLFSLIFGAGVGIVSLIPFLGVISFLIIIFCSSFIILIILKKTGNIICPNEQTGLFYGGISGFIAFIGFIITFLPLSYILSFVFKESYYTGISLILKGGFVLSTTLIVFIGILCAMMNSFSGLASIYFFNSENKDKKFTLDIKKGKNNGVRIKNKNNRMDK